MIASLLALAWASHLGAVPTRRKSARSPVDATVAARRSAYRRPRLYGMMAR
jgi:hypothetical protein